MATNRQSGFENILSLPVSGLVYETSRSEVVKNDNVRFLEFWDIERIAKAGRLHDMFNKILFRVGGYDKDESELCEIPEVRSFFRELAQKWPYFLYACNLEDGFYGQLIWCMVPSLSVMRTSENQNRYITKADPQDINKAHAQLAEGLVRAFQLDKTMNQEAFDKRIEEAKHYVLKRVVGRG